MKTLVVDSSATMRRIMVQSLHRIGHGHTAEATSGTEAMDVLAGTLAGTLDVIICAGTLKDMTGTDFVRMVRASPAYAHLPVLLVFTRSTRQEAPAALAAGANDYLVKPLTPQAIKEKLAAFLPSAAA